MTLSAHEVQKLKHAPAVEGVVPLFHQRWSPRAFAEREVAPVDLKRVFEAARWAASSYNEQPWKFLVGVRGAKGDGAQTYEKIFAALIDFNKAWAATAPVLILGAAKTKFSHNESPNGYALYDLGAACSYLTLQAAALGLGTHQMAGFDQGVARKLLEIPEDYVLGAVIALGYQGEPSALGNDQLIEREVEVRTRKPLSEFVFTAWNEPAKLG
jgi:nitroreductase